MVQMKIIFITLYAMPARRIYLHRNASCKQPFFFTSVHFAFLTHAEVAELVDALDSGSSGMYVLWGFKSPLRHQPSS